MRPKSTARDLPPRMLRRKKRLRGGKVWVGYYYNSRDEDGRRVEVPLGSELNEAKRMWAVLERRPADNDTSVMRGIFDRYVRDVLPTKASKTQSDYMGCLIELRKVFDSAPIDAITPQVVAQYRDKRSAKVRANREIAVLSLVYNHAREWGFTAKENPCRGVHRNKETPRDYYADDEVWSAVYASACIELKDAMDVAYLTGQRPADVLRMMETDIKDGMLSVKQGKTSKRLRIQLDGNRGRRTQLGSIIDHIRARPRKVRSLYLVATPDGRPLNKGTLRLRWDAARSAAVVKAEKEGTKDALELAQRIRQFQFRDIRPKAASEIKDLGEASKLLGHTEEEITKTVYRRVGEIVKPTR